jgi:vacuolar-type H+-ATPase catalytic subunit A/Vma1
MKLTSDLRQRHVERWSEAYNAQFSKTVVAHHGANCRAAIEAGIVTGITADDIGDMMPHEVSALSEQVSQLISEALAPPEKKQ